MYRTFRAIRRQSGTRPERGQNEARTRSETVGWQPTRPRKGYTMQYSQYLPVVPHEAVPEVSKGKAYINQNKSEEKSNFTKYCACHEK